MLFSIFIKAEDKPKPIIYLVTEHLPPYQILSDNKSLSGFSVDVITQTLIRSEYPFTLKSYPWLRSYNLALNKTNHCIFSIARLATREKLFKWVGPLSEVNNAVIWGLEADDIVINTLNDAKAYMIAVNRNDITHTGLTERGFIDDKHLYVLNDIKSLVKLLMSRPEIDLIVADDITITYRAKIAGVPMKKLKRVFEIKDLPLNFFFACSNHTDDSIIADLTESLESLYLDGTYQDIWHKWQDKLNSPSKK